MYSGQVIDKTISPEQQQVLANISAHLTELYTQFNLMSEQAEQIKQKKADEVQKTAEEINKQNETTGAPQTSQEAELEKLREQFDDLLDGC